MLHVVCQAHAEGALTLVYPAAVAERTCSAKWVASYPADTAQATALHHNPNTNAVPLIFRMFRPILAGIWIFQHWIQYIRCTASYCT